VNIIAATERSRTFQKITFTINRAAIVEPNPIEKNQRKLATIAPEEKSHLSVGN
jgi:hypothetical protein